MTSLRWPGSQLTGVDRTRLPERRESRKASWASIEAFMVERSGHADPADDGRRQSAFGRPHPGRLEAVEAALDRWTPPSVYLQHWVCRRCCCIDY